MRKILLLITILLSRLLLNAQVNMPLVTLNFQFERVKKICDKDNGKLWGKSLYGPILVIDKTSRVIVANQLDKRGQLKQQGKVFVGNYPEKSIVASTATTFSGKTWAMVSYPFNSDDTFDIYSTYVHESFHRIQSELGFLCKGYNNSHMDNMDARIYLNLEWQALLKAIDTSGTGRIKAIKDALSFRQYRRHLFPGADSMENRFEMHEGLAEYTAFKLCCNSKTEFKENVLQLKLKYLNNEGACVRTFGYFSGLLYGYLLDETGTPWQKELKCEADLGLLLQNLSKINLSNDTVNVLNQSKKLYEYDKIYAQELEINNKKEQILKDYINRFTKTPLLIIDLIKPTYGIYMSPHPLDTLGTVYPVINISDKWGILKVKDKGCLLKLNTATVAADQISIKEQTISGEGWILELNKDWIIVKQSDNYFIKEKETVH